MQKNTIEILQQQLHHLIENYGSKIYQATQSISSLEDQYKELLQKEIQYQRLLVEKTYEKQLDEKVTALRKENDSAVKEAVRQAVETNKKELTDEFMTECNELLLKYYDIQSEYENEKMSLQTDIQYQKNELLHQLNESNVALEKEVELVKQTHQDKVKEWQIEINILDRIVKFQFEYEEQCEKVEKFSNQLLILKDILKSRERATISSVWEELRAIAEIDDICSIYMSLFPSEIIMNGVESHKRLRDQFSQVEKAGIKAGYLPQNPSIWGYALSEVFAFLTIRERDLDVLMLDKSDCAKLHRAGYFLEQGNLRKSVEEIKKIEDSVILSACSNWLSDAENRLKIESCVEFLDTRTLIISSIGERQLAAKINS